MVPFEGWNLRAPSYNRLAPFGQRCVVTVPLIDRQMTGTTKLSRGMKAIFLGFAPNKKGYLVELESGKIIDCSYQDVKFVVTEVPAQLHSPVVPASSILTLDLASADQTIGSSEYIPTAGIVISGSASSNELSTQLL